MTLTAEKPQYEIARESANRIRFARAELKRDIKTGVVTLPEVLLADIPDWLVGMKVEKLVLAVPRVGPRVASRWLARVPTHPHSHIGYLTMRQRLLLAEISSGKEV